MFFEGRFRIQVNLCNNVVKKDGNTREQAGDKMRVKTDRIVLYHSLAITGAVETAPHTLHKVYSPR